jgi:hypothetical protein
MAFLPFIEEIQQVLFPLVLQSQNVFVKYFVDDGSTVCPFETMIQVLNVMKESGPKNGYLMNLKKSVYVLILILILIYKLLL